MDNEPEFIYTQKGGHVQIIFWYAVIRVEHVYADAYTCISPSRGATVNMLTNYNIKMGYGCKAIAQAVAPI